MTFLRPRPAGAWHHVAATFNGTTRTLYIDGVAINSDTPTGHAVPTAANLRIGSTNNGEYFPGSIDEVRVWSVARTAAQINAAKGAGLPGSTAGLVAYYRLNEGSGLTTADATGNAANLGTLTNAPTWTTDAAPVTNAVPVTLTVTDAGGNTSSQVATVTMTVPATPTTTWSGTSSTDWADCANWSYGKVPDATTNVVIPTGQPRYPSLTTGNTYATLALTVNTGGSLTLAHGAILQVSGNFANNGATTLSGTVAFVGSAATQMLGGSISTPFTTLEANKASGTVQFDQVLTINSALTLTSGTLTTTSSYQVNLGTPASISESETSYVIGKVVVTRTLAAGTAESFSGLGLTPAAGSTVPGATPVTRVTGTALTGVGTSQSVQRYFDIQPTVNTGLNVTMDFAYFTHELNGIPTASLMLFKSESGTSGPWAYQRPTSLAANVVTKTGITSFSIWTLGNPANPLPVELTTFTATAEGKAAVRLAWTTASEKNSDRFEVERSLSGTGFERIGTVAGQGTKATATDYALLDGKLPANATTLYYRLRLVDLDGTFSYSPVRVVALTASTAPQLLAYPNPAHTTVLLLLLGPATTAPLQVYDALGRLVHSQAAPAIGAEAVLPLASLPTGVYVLRCGALTQRLMLE